MTLDPSNSSNLEQLALKGLIDVVTLCDIVSRARRPHVQTVTECRTVEWVIFVAALTLGNDVLLIAGA